jgi:hypothetical protein
MQENAERMVSKNNGNESESWGITCLMGFMARHQNLTFSQLEKCLHYGMLGPSNDELIKWDEHRLGFWFDLIKQNGWNKDLYTPLTNRVIRPFC